MLTKISFHYTRTVLFPCWNKYIRTLTILVILLILPVVSHALTLNQLMDNLYRWNQMQKLKDYTKEDVQWLAYNIYFEARGEGIHGMMVVGMVTINRVLHRKWPSTIKGVVQQKYQFSWYNDRVVPPIKNQNMMDDCFVIAKMTIDLYNSFAESEGFGSEFIAKGATHYFNDKIAPPSWAQRLVYEGKVGAHLLYSLPKKG